MPRVDCDSSSFRHIPGQQSTRPAYRATHIRRRRAPSKRLLIASLTSGNYKMTIRHRITLLVVLMFVALSAIGAYAVYQTRCSAAEVRQVTEGVVPSALASADLVSQVKDVQLATMTLVYAPDANMVAQAQDDLTKKRASLQQALALQAKDAASHAQKGLVSQAND